jgi:serine/threonine-protein kinase
MGAVYRAWDLRLNIPVACKEMIPQPGLDEETLQELKAQFHREAASVANFDHPNLVNVSDFFEESQNVYLVMNFIAGENLQAYIAHHGPLPEPQILTWADQILDALTYIHDRGIIHRDIKPHNILIRPDGRAILSDFGLVKLWDPSDPHTKTVIRAMGSPGYAPPEQYDPARGHTDPRSDLYSLGATLYHAFTGEVPPTATERIVNPESLNAIRTLNPGVSPHVERTLFRALALRPVDRFQSAQEMQQALRSPSMPRPESYARPEAPNLTPAPSSSNTTQRSNTPWAWILPLLGLSLLCLGLTGGGVFYVFFRPASGTAPDPTLTITKTITEEPSSSPTTRPSLAPTETATPRDATSTTVPSPTPTVRATSTPVVPTDTPQPTCPDVTGTFASLWQQYQGRLGCATRGVYSIWTAYEPFEGGWMVWREDTDEIWVLYHNHVWESFPNQWYEGDPTYTCPDIAPNQSPPTPLRGFGKLWCTHAGVRNQLGNALSAETGSDSLLQDFDRGVIVKTGFGTYVLYADQTWTQ